MLPQKPCAVAVSCACPISHSISIAHGSLELAMDDSRRRAQGYTDAEHAQRTMGGERHGLQSLPTEAAVHKRRDDERNDAHAEGSDEGDEELKVGQAEGEADREHRQHRTHDAAGAGRGIGGCDEQALDNLRRGEHLDWHREEGDGGHDELEGAREEAGGVEQDVRLRARAVRCERRHRETREERDADRCDHAQDLAVALGLVAQRLDDGDGLGVAGEGEEGDAEEGGDVRRVRQPRLE
mmetsp:Transcript_39010/g.107623  ORF Transcript_39010/g.107623 Transcript_39010/m.107623 type:complete len:239 (-) Transcript_39010:506-1222(-)